MNTVNTKLSRAFLFLNGGLLVVVALGVLTRAMNAGLACPDWPLCFGDLIPDYHPQVYLEFVHRALAGLLGLVVIFLCAVVFLNKSYSFTQRAVALGTVFVLGFQVFLGWKTVVDLLDEKIVSAHLIFGFTLFVMSSWLFRSLSSPVEKASVSRGVNLWVYVGLLAIVIQVGLGALVASHYAAVVCVDFPLCGGKWIPTLRGVVGLHVLHRLGAYLVGILVLSLFVMTRKMESSEFKSWVGKLLGLVCLQFVLGISNVVFYRPPLLTMFHSLVAALIVMSIVRILHTREC